MLEPRAGGESERLDVLRSYDVLDTVEDADFNDVAELAAQICGTPVSLVTLVDEHRQWFKAEKGFGQRETPRHLSFCSHAIERDGVMVVPDATLDARFRDNQLVTDDPNIRFYAGAPLVTPDGYRLGTLCVIDKRPRELGPDQLKALEALARQVSALLELRVYKRRVEKELHAAAKPEDGLRNAWDSVRDLTRKIRDVFLLVDPSSDRIAYISPSFDLLWGRPRDEFVGEPVQRLADAAHPDDKALIRPTPGEGVEYRIVSQEGEIRWVTQEVFVVGMSQGDQLAVIASDVTEKVAARTALAESEERFRLLVDSVEEYAIYMLDPHGFVSSWNSGAQRIKGYTPDEIIGRHFSTFYTEHDLEADVPASALSTARQAGTYRSEGWRVRKNGETFWASVVISPLIDDRGRIRGFAKVTRDLTERLQAEEERLRLERSALHAQKLEVVGRLAGGIAHDFNNLLAIMAGSAALIEQNAEDIDSIREETKEIIGTTERGAKLVEQLVTISRPTSGKPSRLDLNEVIEATKSLLNRAVGADVSISTILGEDLPDIEVDKTHMEQILLNLAVNARDAMPRGGELTFRTDVIGSGPAGEASVKLTVSDTGEGIHPDVAEHIFEPFFTTKGKGGSGLGLSTVSSLVAGSGGDISVRSEEASGATFEILFPVAGPSATAARESPRPLSGMNILLVEDEAPLRRIIRKTLAAQGAEVTDEGSPNMALDAVRSGLRPHVLLTDVVMPERKGPDLAREILAISPSTSVLFISGYAQTELERRAVEIGSFLSKPFTPTGLIDAVLKTYVPAPETPGSRNR